MKAITIRQPWAELIVAGTKTVENRTWQTSHRGTLAIHASQNRVDPGGQGLPRGVVVGTVKVSDVHPAAYCPGDCGEYAHPTGWHWMLTDPFRFVVPIPATGGFHLWEWPA